jgi:D-alanine-D-alanine ligase
MSLGITVARTEDELREAVSRIISEFNQHVLVEEFIEGRELTVGLLGNGDVEALPVVELDLRGDAAKIRVDEGRDPLEKICPAPLKSEQTAQLQAIARRAFIALGLNDYGRIDVRMDKDGNPHVLEINSMADLGQDGAYVFSARHAGYSYEALINRILNVAAARYFGEESVEEPAAKAASKTRAAQPQTLSGRVRSFLRSQSSTSEDTLEGLAELSNHSQILERVQKHLSVIGFEWSDELDSDATNLAYFKNHGHKKSQALLVATVETPMRSQPLRRSGDDSRFYGDKTIESLGGLTVMLSALRALRFSNTLKDIRCGVLLALGLDSPAEIWQSSFGQVARRADFVLGLGASDSHGALLQSRRGSAAYRLEGKFHFGRRARPTSDTAVNQFLRLLAGIQALTDPRRGIGISLTRSELYAEPGQLPGKLEAECVVAFRSSAQARRLDRRIRALAGKSASAGVDFHVEGGIQCPALPNSAGSRKLYRQVERVAKELNVTVSPVTNGEPSVFNFAGDSVPALDGFGPASGADVQGSHFILRYSIAERAALLSLAMCRLCEVG